MSGDFEGVKSDFFEEVKAAVKAAVVNSELTCRRASYCI